MSNSQRRKGHSFERKIARQLKEAGIDARRGQQYASGSTEPDVTILDRHLSYLWPELKCGKSPSLWRALEQADSAACGSKTPLVILHRDRGPTVACMHWHNFLELLLHYRDLCEKNDE